METDAIKLKGIHNYENIMSAICAVKQLSLEDSVIRKYLKSFIGVEHRIEFVEEIEGRKFYNDSKATNIKSTKTALQTMENPTILLLGGLDRGQKFEELEKDLKTVRTIIGYGECRESVYKAALALKKECFIFETLEEAVKKAYKTSDKGNNVLLSPAAASWDQYKNYEKRGEKFKQVVHSLKKDA